MSISSISTRLSRKLSALDFAPPVTHVYNPVEYASGPHSDYLDRFARPGCEAIFLGMNPGPWGMAQTGVPFGEVELVRDWMGISGPVKRPPNEHPKRPVLGFDCKRSEVSGRRVWGWAKERFGTPDAFFDRFFVWNYCPLSFMEESGKNRTPDKLPVAERAAIYALCDAALSDVVRELAPGKVIGVGAFAETRARQALGEDAAIGRVLHPSPASPAANRGWSEQVERQLAQMGFDVG
ncbi:MAG: single-stranded DNA-binding protein [Planctomycetota bacterium]|nr:single-stranded DNA-binding protein [Planctomycetota bacterium]